jgi:hypothetical protein
MNFMNDNGNIKQFQLVKFINENCTDDHVVSKISIVLRRDKIEAPYYMVTKIKLSACLDNSDKGLFHAMDMLNHHRRHNLPEEKYGEIRALADDVVGDERVKVTDKENQLQMTMLCLNDEEFFKLYNDYQELFDLIDNLVE